MTSRQFIPHGPSIPAEILQAQVDGQLIFFCGAGISKGTGLPLFDQLVRDVRAAVNHPTDDALEEAIEGNQYDKALEIIEQAEVELRGSMRRAVMRTLIKPPCEDVELGLHRAIFALAQPRRRPGEVAPIHLVTTNYDDRFERAGLPLDRIEQGPRLGRPRPGALARAVYLHGRIEHELPEDRRNLSELVLTSADFGNAYLREGWAARFIIELFREFTILFVGYSLNDPVMRYLMDAFATESHPGGQFKPAYAFASYSTAKEGDRERQERLWRAKNVTPIVYSNDHPGAAPHALLSETLTAWAEEDAAGLSGRLGTALKIARRPYVAGSSDAAEFDEVATLAWALATPDGAIARQFVTADPPPSIDWLIPVLAREIRHPEKPHKICQLLDINALRPAIASWIDGQLGRAEAIEWAVTRRGELFEDLARRIELRFNGSSGDELPPLAVRFWRATLIGWDARRVLSYSLPNATLATEGGRLTAASRQALLASLHPRLTGPTPSYLSQLSGASPEYLSQIAKFNIEFAKEHADIFLDGSLKKLHMMISESEIELVIGNLVDDLTTILLDYLDIANLVQLPPGCKQSHFERQSLARPDQERHPDCWVYVLNLLLQSWRAANATELDLARAAAMRWFQLWIVHGHGLFLRLALFAAAEPHGIEPAPILRALFDLPDGIWEHEWRAELLRLVRVHGRNIDRKTMSLYKAQVCAGPPRSLYKEDVTESEFAIYRQRAIDEHLSALLKSGTKLNRALRKRVEAAHDRVEAQRAHWRAGGFHVGEDAVPLIGSRSGYVMSPSAGHLKGKSTEGIVQAVRGYHDEWGREERAGELLAAVLRQEPDRMAEIGEALLNQGEKRDQVWSSFWGAGATFSVEMNIIAQLPRLTALAIEHEGIVPTDTLHAICLLLKKLAATECLEGESLASFWRLWDGVAAHAQAYSKEPTKAIDLTDAINEPSGVLAQALIERLRAIDPPKGARLPTDLAERFSLLGEDDGHAGSFARTALAPYLSWLYYVDPTWTQRAILARMDWQPGNRPDTLAIWRGYLFAPRWTVELLGALKQSLLEALRHGPELGATAFENLCRTFVGAPIEQPDCFDDKEINVGITAIGPNGLANGVQQLRDMLSGAGDEAEELWQLRIGPWIEHYWPDASAFLSDNVAVHANELLLETKAAFPEAVGLLKGKYLVVKLGGENWRRAVRSILIGIHQGDGSDWHGFDYLAKFPAEMAKWLTEVTAPDRLSPWHKRDLRHIAERLDNYLSPGADRTAVKWLLEASN